ncbi:MAG TPA: glycosyltransferase family 4 protein [Solirubrobacteraceae bacterium]|nr:glycosyltransferase family 4 protein [Solirubrobacteraceae bacterium]
MKVGIVANEFFDKRFGRMGGFGWVAWAAARALRDSGRYEPVYVTTEVEVPGGRAESDGVPLLGPAIGRGSVARRAGFVRRVLAERLDLFLTVDWRPHYRKAVLASPRTPMLVWVQDPRTTFDVKRVYSLKVPGEPDDVEPQSIGFIDCTSLREAYARSRALRRPVAMAGHARYLEEKLEGTYGMRPPEYGFLPDPVRLPDVVRAESAEPEVVFLGRMDPIKRPWLFFDLAERFPHVQFHLLGQSHFSGPGAWTMPDPPANLHLAGHVGEAEKFDRLRRAWVVVNTSIHEALPISFLEALVAEVPILSMQNPDELGSRFGEFVGRWDGDGRSGLEHLSRGLERLLSDGDLRRELGAAGRAWV